MEDWRKNNTSNDNKSEKLLLSIARQRIWLHWVLWFIPYISIVTGIISGILIRSWKPWVIGNIVGFTFGVMAGASGDPSLLIVGTLLGSGVAAGLTHQEILNTREYIDEKRNNS